MNEVLEMIRNGLIVLALGLIGIYVAMYVAGFILWVVKRG
jgi:hypothetical protein